jgi:hypothetical protein
VREFLRHGPLTDGSDLYIWDREKKEVVAQIDWIDGGRIGEGEPSRLISAGGMQALDGAPRRRTCRAAGSVAWARYLGRSILKSFPWHIRW